MTHPRHDLLAGESWVSRTTQSRILRIKDVLWLADHKVRKDSYYPPPPIIYIPATDASEAVGVYLGTIRSLKEQAKLLVTAAPGLILRVSGR